MTTDTTRPSVIGSFHGEYSFLSNFHPSLIPTPWGVWVPTAEHMYQAAKCAVPEQREAILNALTPRLAKRLGRSVELRADWEAIKIPIMRECLARKFSPGSELASLLLGTGDAMLVEGNNWGDRIWGKVDGEGANWLGHLLMARRAVLRAG